MIKKINFKKVLCIFVMAFSLLMVIACSKDVSTKYMWDDFVEAYNAKDLNKLSLLYYDASNAESWVSAQDANYFGGVELVSKSYEEKTFSDFSTETKVEKYYAAEVVCDVKVNGTSKEYKFDVFYLDSGKGLHFVSELNFIVVTEEEVSAAEAEFNVKQDELTVLTNEKDDKETLIYDTVSEPEEIDRLVAELEAEYGPIIEALENEVEKLEAKVERLEKLKSSPIGQVASDLWLKSAYYTNDNYIYQRSFAANGTYAVGEEKLYEMAISTQLKNEKNVVIPNEIDGYTVTKIDDYAFYRITRLLTFTVKSSKMKTLEIPSTVVEIGKNAFYQCGKLEEINIPSNVKKIGANAFASCTSAKRIVLNVDDNNMYLDENGNDYREDEANKVTSKNSTTFAYPISISGGFKQVYQGEIIVLTAVFDGDPQSQFTRLADIEWEAKASDGNTIAGVQFEKTASSGVVNVVLGIAASELGSTGKEITISAYDKNNILNKASITMKVVCPSVQKSIDCTAFDRCNSLKEFVITSYNPYSISLSNGTQFSLSKDAIIYVPKGCVNKYKTSTIWAQYADQIREME